MKNDNPKSSRIAMGVAVGAGILATILRIVPHPTNFNSVGALSLFGGARVRTWHAYLIPLGIMIFSDLAIWVISRFNYDYSLGHPSRFFVYASFMIYVWIGRQLITRNSIGPVALASVLGGVQFFLVTNLGVWLFQPIYTMAPLYSQDWNGLLMCYAAALPFYQGETDFAAHPLTLLTDFKLTLFWTILGDILFTWIYLMIHEKLAQRADAEQCLVAASEMS